MGINVCGECAKVEVSITECNPEYLHINTNVPDGDQLYIIVKHPNGEIVKNYYTSSVGLIEPLITDWFTIDHFTTFEGSMIITGYDLNDLPITFNGKPCIELSVYNSISLG